MFGLLNRGRRLRRDTLPPQGIHLACFFFFITASSSSPPRLLRHSLFFPLSSLLVDADDVGGGRVTKEKPDGPRKVAKDLSWRKEGTDAPSGLGTT